MFSKKHDPANNPAPRPVFSPPANMGTKPMASSNSTFSVIGSDVTITGNVAASTELHVDGNVEGDITCASLVLGEGSVVKGVIQAESARLSGTVTGSISARELVILKSARIDGDVHYDALTIEQGATVEGRFAPRTAKSAPATKSDHRNAEPLSGSPKSGDEEPKLTLAG